MPILCLYLSSGTTLILQERCALRQEDIYPLLNEGGLPDYLAPESSSYSFAKEVQSEILAGNQVCHLLLSSDQDSCYAIWCKTAIATIFI